MPTFNGRRVSPLALALALVATLAIAVALTSLLGAREPTRATCSPSQVGNYSPSLRRVCAIEDVEREYAR